MDGRNSGLKLFSTSPQSSAVQRESYVKQVIDVARWSEDAGCEGILVYTDNSLVDCWLVSQIIVQNTERLCPLVAVQPVYMHPYSVAKMVTSIGHLYNRRIYLNMVAGGFKNDLAALNDTTPHDKRYARLVEYTSIIKQLLLGSLSPTTYRGEFYLVDKLQLTPPLSAELFPGIFVSGSSQAGLAAAAALGATAVKYPQRASEETDCSGDEVPPGVRVGIIAREKEAEAWDIARTRFPVDRKGELRHQLAMKTSDSQWHQQLSHVAEEQKTPDTPYWLVPFQQYQTFCPYLVGSYDRIAAELRTYVERGYKTFILDIPPDREELEHIKAVFARTEQIVTQ